MKKLARKTWEVIRYLYLRLMGEGFSYRAASLAYATLLAIVPLMIVSFSILSFFPVFEGVQDQLQSLILNNFVAESATNLTQHLNEFLSHVHKLSPVNVIFLILLDLLMLYNINKAFDSVWRVKAKINVSLSFLIYFVVLMLSPLIFGGVLVLGTMLYKVGAVSNLVNYSFIKTIFYTVLPHLVILATFTIFNWILPSQRVKFTHALLGGILTTLIFELAKYGFGLYLTHVQTYRLLYGALATLPLFLIWLYVSWLIILLGALVTNWVAVGIPEQWKRRIQEQSL